MLLSWYISLQQFILPIFVLGIATFIPVFVKITSMCHHLFAIQHKFCQIKIIFIKFYDNIDFKKYILSHFITTSSKTSVYFGNGTHQACSTNPCGGYVSTLIFNHNNYQHKFRKLQDCDATAIDIWTVICSFYLMHYIHLVLYIIIFIKYWSIYLTSFPWW